MTVKELCQRLARWTSSQTLSQMSVEDQLILLDCINAGIYNWFAAAPEQFRMTTASHLLRAPEHGTVDVVEGDNDLVGLVLQEYHLGATIEISGERNMNEIVSVSGTPQVLNQHTQTGTVGYSIYFDTIMLTDHNVSRITGHPRILDKGQQLYHDEDGMKHVGAERRGAIWGSVNWWDVGNVRTFGIPYRYVYENTGLSLGDEARIMIRVDPIPSEAMTVQFDAAFDAPTYDLSDIDGTTTIPVPDQYVLPHLLPLALGDLAVSPIWGGSDADTAIRKSTAIIQKMGTDISPRQGTPHNYVRTRPGW